MQKGFIVATLISTIVGTITASMTLHDKVQDKRDRKRQKALDGKQTGDIEALRKQVAELKSGQDDNREQSRSPSRSRSRRGRRRRPSYEEDDFAYESRRSRAMIERMYEDHLMRAGDRYATGDIVTENRLQAQIIKLQQTVINVLQDALYSGRGLTEADQRRLIVAQSAARDGSLDALQDHYDRVSAKRKVLPRPEHDDRLLLDTAPAGKSDFSRKSTWPTRDPGPRSLPPPATAPSRRADSLPPPDLDLYCRYSADLQTISWALSSSFAPSSSHDCPACGFHVPVDTRDYWIFSTTTPAGRTREFRVDARFIVKCHTPEGNYACVLCEQEQRTHLCIARTVEALVKHLGSSHSVEEWAEDPDVESVRGEGVTLDGRELVLR